MKLLIDHFRDLINTTDKWKYYHELDVANNIDAILEQPKDFIKKYLNVGGKLTTKLETVINNLGKDRLQHTVSIFFLGLLFYYKCNIIKSEIYECIDKIHRGIESNDYNVKFDFIYWWFLICFFHDIGYAYHENENLTIFGENRKVKVEEKVIEELEKIKEQSDNFVPDVIIHNWKIYLNRKREDGNKINHGILAGAYYIYSLTKITNDKLSGKTEDVVDKLYWSKSFLEKVHKPIAWIIVAHNIWYINKNCEETKNIKKYKDAKLQDLIIEKPIITLKEYPLLFLLCLVDTIDPKKYLKDECVDDILKNTKIQFSPKNELTINLKGKLEKYNACFQNHLGSMVKWLDVRITLNFS